MANRRNADERFEVVLTDLGPRKTSVVKLVRELLGLGLVEAVHFVENLPQVVARDVLMAKGHSLVRRFQEVDAGAELEDGGST